MLTGQEKNVIKYVLFFILYYTTLHIWVNYVIRKMKISKSQVVKFYIWSLKTTKVMQFMLS